MASKIFKNTRKKISEGSRWFIKNSFEIINRIDEIRNHHGVSQKELAKKLGKSDSEISKILSPGHNLTLKTLSKIEAALGEEILFVGKSRRISVVVKIVYLVETKEKRNFVKAKPKRWKKMEQNQWESSFAEC